MLVRIQEGKAGLQHVVVSEWHTLSDDIFDLIGEKADIVTNINAKVVCKTWRTTTIGVTKKIKIKLTEVMALHFYFVCAKIWKMIRGKWTYKRLKLGATK